MHIYRVLLGLVLFGTQALVAEEVFETPPKLSFQEVLPEQPLKTDLYKFDEDVTNDGVSNYFSLYSVYGVYTIIGNEFAQERVREIETIDKLNEIKKTKAYADGLKAAGESAYNNIKTLVTKPVDTLGKIPKGVGRFFGNAYRTTKSERRGRYQDSAAKEWIGFSKVKRALAYDFGVDPYSSNHYLQDALTDVAWAMYAGALSVAVVEAFVIPEPVRSPLRVSTASVRVSKLVRDESPEGLQKINQGKLEALGASEQQIERLFTNTWFSPRRATILTEALYSLRTVKNIAAYLDHAVEAASEEEACFMHRSAEMMSAYHESQAALTELLIAGELPVAASAQGKLVAFFMVDYLVWMRSLAETASAIRGDLPAKVGEAKVELWLSERVSPKARSGLEAKGFLIKEKALEILFKAAESAE